MTTIRTAQPHELPALLSTGDPTRDTETAAYLLDLLAKNCTRPQWCFVADHDDTVTGTIVLWARPGHDTPDAFVLLDTDWNEPGLTTAHALLQHALAEAAALGATDLGHVIDSPAQAPQWQNDPQIRRELLDRNGFSLNRDGLRYGWTAGRALPEQDGRLTWRSMTELGEEPFLELLEELIADTADSLIQADIRRLGLRGAAELLWSDCLDMRHEPDWYEIGYDADGSAAAVSLPSHSASFPVIGFVGVSPRHRGKGYSTSVVVRGSHILVDNGATEIRGDCDRGNIAMAKGFSRAGYDNFADRLEFGRAL